MPEAVTHPNPEVLSAFGLGKLPEAAAAAVAGHLEVCSVCRQAVERLPPDSFMGKVRAAKPGGSSLPPTRSLHRVAGAPIIIDNAAAPPVPPDHLPPELAHHPKYRIVRELGRGGMGVVYQAVHTHMDRLVALKVINPTLLQHPDALPRFQAEVRAAARLDHSNIVRAYDAEQVGDLHLLVMEFVEGLNLSDLVNRKGPLPVAHACHYARQAALGLQHAFEQGMVHRDIKPHNLMLAPRSLVKVLDFGLARLRGGCAQGGGLTTVGSFMGTPEYVSPEQATDARSADTRADLYSLGCTLYFLLAGRPPFQENTDVKLVLAQIEKEAPALHEVRPDVPAGLSAVVARLLAKDPARRYQKPVEVAQALVPFIKGGVKGETKVVLASPPGVASPSKGTMIAGATSKFQELLKEEAGEAPPGKAAGKDEAVDLFGDLAVAAVPSKKNPKSRKAAKPVSVLAVVVALALGAWLLGGVIFKAKVKTADGEAVVVLEVDQPGAEVLVDGQRITVNVPGDNQPVEIKATAGEHKLRISKNGFEAVTRDIELKTGTSNTIKIRLEPVPFGAPPSISLPQQAKNPGDRQLDQKSTPDVRPAGEETAVPSQSLRLWPLSDLILMENEDQVIQVKVERQGYKEPISVLVEGLPDSVTAQPATIGVDQDAAQLKLSAAPGAEEVEKEVLVLATGGTLTAEKRFKVTVKKAEPSRPFQVTMNGLAGLQVMEPSTFGPDWLGQNGLAGFEAWRAHGAFAKLASKDCLGFPRVPVSCYVFETELEFLQKDGGLRLCLGDPWSAVHINLNWNKDRQKVDCQLAAWRNGGWWWNGNHDFDVRERLYLKLVVADGRQALFHRNTLILAQSAWPADLALRIWSETPDSALMYRCSFRELKEEDLKQLDWVMPSRNLISKPEETAARLDKVKGGLQSLPDQGRRFAVGATGAPMAWVPPGQFEMGSRDPKDAGRHQVRLTKGFWMGQYEVTQGEWAKVMSFNPSRIQGSPYLPVDWVTWEEAMRFCQALTTSEQKVGRLPVGYEYRLPTEAEWEYACRAGSDEDFSVKPEDVLSRDHSDWRPHEVGEKPPNSWGLYDMHGNVMEWCYDAWYDYPKQAAGTIVNPVHPGRADRDTFVARGGAWWIGTDACSSFWRDKNHSSPAGGFRGFRIVLGPICRRT